MVIKWTLLACFACFAATVIALDSSPQQSSESVVPAPNSTSSRPIDPSTTANVTSSNPVDIKNVTETPTTTTTASTTTTSTQTPIPNAVEAEKGSSLSIFFVLCVIALGILLIHLMLQTHFQYLPESIVTVCLGALIGAFLNFTQIKSVFEREEVFSPTAFFLVLLPPIIFESGYNL